MGGRILRTLKTIGLAIALLFAMLVLSTTVVAPSINKHEPVEPTEETITMETVDPVDLMTDNLLSVVFEYVKETDKEMNISRRQEITDYIQVLRDFREKLLKGGSVYQEQVSKVDDKIVDLIALDIRYCADYEAILEQEELARQWRARLDEYPVATKVWLHLKEEMGYSDAVCAGILGNIMAECGGGTLELKWDAVNKSSKCYGLCQWHPRYYKAVQGATLEQQLEFMSTSFPEVLSKYISVYYKHGYTYEDFLALEDPAQVAYIFCVVYERPGPGTYDMRRANALKAFNYFTTWKETNETP